MSHQYRDVGDGVLGDMYGEAEEALQPASEGLEMGQDAQHGAAGLAVTALTRARNTADFGHAVQAQLKGQPSNPSYDEGQQEDTDECQDHGQSNDGGTGAGTDADAPAAADAPADAATATVAAAVATADAPDAAAAAAIPIAEWDYVDGNESEGGNDGEVCFDIKTVRVDQISERLRAIADARKSSIRKCPKVRNRKLTPGRKRKKTLAFAERKAGSIQEAWVEDLRKLHRAQPDFFTSREATLEDESVAIKGKPAYSALPLTQFNNSDVQEIFMTEYDRKVRNGGSLSSFLQMVTVAGQFLRLHIVLGYTNVKTCCEPGSLYRAVCDRESIDIFLNYYDAKGQCTTVMTKALHLRKMAEYAKVFYSDRDVHLTAEAERSRLKLQKVYNTQKSLGRSRANHRKQLEERVAEGTVFLEEDFRRSFKIVKNDLDGLISLFQSTRSSQGTKAAVERLDSQQIMRKWSMNLLLMLIFSAAGQRPQVYTTLQCPDDNELIDMKEQARRVHFFEMRTTVEKTKRKADYPNVLVHSSALVYVKFHQQIARKIIVRRTEVEEDGDPSKPLLMHTENGEFLSTSQVTRVLKNFMKCHFPDLDHITMMSLRSSYGTMMMAAYRDKRLFRGLEEDAFLGILGKVMNTSVEQLMTTYIGVDRSEFEDSARELNKVLNLGADGDESGSGGADFLG